MTEEEAYEEALRRIREAEETGELELDLSGRKEGKTASGLETLTRLPPELARLTSLQTLNLSWCWQLNGDLSPLAGLTSLQLLDLSWCKQLSGDLSPLAGLTSLQALNLSGSDQLSDFSALTGLSSLQSLDLSDCCELSGDLRPLARLTSLQLLNLFRCSKLRGDLSPLAELTSLRSLDLSWCKQLRGDLCPLAGNFDHPCGVHRQPIDQLAHVQEATNGMEPSRSAVLASRENRHHQRATGPVYRTSFSIGGYRHLTPRFFPVSI